MERNGMWYYKTSKEDEGSSYVREIVFPGQEPYFFKEDGQRVDISLNDLEKKYDRLASAFEVRLIHELDCPIEDSVKMIIEPHVFEEDTAKHNKLYKGYLVKLQPQMGMMTVDDILMNRGFIRMDIYYEGTFSGNLNKYIDPSSYRMDAFFNGYYSDTSQVVIDYGLTRPLIIKMMESIDHNFKKYEENFMSNLNKLIYKISTACLNFIEATHQDIIDLEKLSVCKDPNCKEIATLYKIVRIDYPGCENDPKILSTLQVSRLINSIRPLLKNEFREYNIVMVRDEEGEACAIMYQRSPIPFRTENDTGFSNDELKHILSL